MRVFPISQLWGLWRDASKAQRLLVVYSIGITILYLKKKKEPESAPLWPTLPPVAPPAAAVAAPEPVELDGLTEEENGVVREGKHLELTGLSAEAFAERSAQIRQLFDVRELLMTERREQFETELVGMMSDLFGLFSSDSERLIRNFKQLYGGVLRSSGEAVLLAYLFKQLGIDHMPEEEPSDFVATLYVLMPLAFGLLDGADPSQFLRCAGQRVEASQRRSREAMGTEDPEAVPLSAFVDKLVGAIGKVPRMALWGLRRWMTLPLVGMQSLIIAANKKKLDQIMRVNGLTLGSMGQPIPEQIAFVAKLTPTQAHYMVTQRFLERDKNTMKVSALFLEGVDVEGASFQAIWQRRQRILDATKGILATHRGYDDVALVETVQAVMGAQGSDGAFVRFMRATRATYIWLYKERPADMVEVVQRFRQELSRSSST